MFEGPHTLTQPSVLPCAQVSGAYLVYSDFGRRPFHRPITFLELSSLRGRTGHSDTTRAEGAIEAQGPLQMERPSVFYGEWGNGDGDESKLDGENISSSEKTG